MSKIKNGGLDQYGAEPFEQQQCGTAGTEGVNCCEPTDGHLERSRSPLSWQISTALARAESNIF